MALKTRKPTGAVPWPLILLEGAEKVGKGWACAVLSASDKVGRTVILDVNEGAWDEYSLIPGARFEIAEHDGTWASVYDVVTSAKEEAAADAAAGKPPFVLVIDGETAIWEGLKDWGGLRARTSRANRAKLEKDPNAEVSIPMNIWNDVNARHRRLMNVLMTFPGIVVITARGGQVAAIGPNGQPVEGQKTYRVEGNKSIGYDVTVWVRLSREEKPVVIGARSVHTGVRPGIDPPKTLPDDWTLEWLVFDALKCDPVTAHARDVTEMRPDAMTPEQIRDEALARGTGFARVQELGQLAEKSGYDDVTLPNENGAEELLLTLLHRVSDAKRKSETAQALNGWTLDGALADAGTAPTKDECRRMWRASSAAVAAGMCSGEDAARVQGILRDRMADIDREDAAADAAAAEQAGAAA